MDITEHYAQLMGLNTPWLIDDVKLDMTDQRIENRIEKAANIFEHYGLRLAFRCQPDCFWKQVTIVLTTQLLTHL